MAEVTRGNDSDDLNEAITASLTSSHRGFFTDYHDDSTSSSARVTGRSITPEEMQYELSTPLADDVEGEIGKCRRIQSSIEKSK